MNFVSRFFTFMVYYCHSCKFHRPVSVKERERGDRQIDRQIDRQTERQTETI